MGLYLVCFWKFLELRRHPRMQFGLLPSNLITLSLSLFFLNNVFLERVNLERYLLAIFSGKSCSIICGFDCWLG